MRRRLRKHPQHHPGQVERDASTTEHRRRLPFGLMWIVLTAIVLVLVILYDRRGIKKAEAHITDGRELEKKGLYVEALNEYDSAFENNRLGRKAKGGVALSMAEIYYKHLEDYPEAHRFYNQARQLAPSLLADKGVQERSRTAATRAEQSGVFNKKTVASDGATTRTIIQRVELLNPPPSDLEGPVVARYKGGEIHAGQLLRALEKRPEFLRPDFREDPARLETFLDGIIRDQLAYQAAISADIHKDPDVTERLYDYQKTLITQRYMVDRREQALVVDNADIEKYYQDNISQYVQPARIEVSLLKSDSETSAAAYLQMLRDGQRFDDVASSYSQHRESAAKGGNIGAIIEKDTTLPGVGEAPHIIDALFKLPVNSVTEVTPYEGSFYVFKVTHNQASRHETLDEARGRIANILRGRSVDQANAGLGEELQSAFAPEIDQDSLLKFWDFAVLEGSITDVPTTATAATTPTSISDSPSTGTPR